MPIWILRSDSSPCHQFSAVCERVVMSGLSLGVADVVDTRVLLGVLARVKGGDFSARMPFEWTGVAGRIADGFNEV